MEVRKRRMQGSPTSVKPLDTHKTEGEVDDKKDNENYSIAELRGSFWLTRIVFIRSIGFIYFVAFLVALDQNGALLGSKGLLPVPLYLQHVRKHFGINSSNWTLFSNIPTLLWWVDDNDIDQALEIIAWCGLLLSAVVIVMGSSNVIISSLLWLLYHSLVNVGQRWYSFGEQFIMIGHHVAMVITQDGNHNYWRLVS